MKMLLLLFLAVLTASASLIPCASGVADVTTLTAGNGCTFGGETNDSFKLDWSAPFTSVDVSITTAEMVGSEATLDFAVTTVPGSTTIRGAWVRLIYHVSSPVPMDSVDLSNVVGDNVRVYESVCAGIIQGGSCMSADRTWLTQGSAGPGQEFLASFTPTTDLYVMKFGALGDASFVGFENGFSAPEPAFLLGGGLLSLGMLKRRKNRVDGNGGA